MVDTLVWVVLEGAVLIDLLLKSAFAILGLSLGYVLAEHVKASHRFRAEMRERMTRLEARQ